jgi:hypothetical protein
MPLEKTGVPAIYKVYGKKGRVKYQLQQNVLVQDPSSPSGFKWKLIGIRFAKFQDAVNHKVKTQAAITAGKYVEPSDATVKEMLMAWLKAGETKGVTKHGKWKIQTYLSHETQYGYIVPKLGEIKASKLRKSQIEQAAAEWKEARSPAVANVLLGTLSRLSNGRLETRTGSALR